MHLVYGEEKVHIFSFCNKVSFEYIVSKGKDAKIFNSQCIINLYAPYL